MQTVSTGRLLLVDSVEDERDIYGAALRAAGFSVVVCNGPDSALAQARNAPTAAIVTRILQPNTAIDGIELTRQIRQRRATRNIAVVIITSRIEPEYRQAATQAGCDSYVLLPAMPETIVGEVQRAITLRSTLHRNTR